MVTTRSASSSPVKKSVTPVLPNVVSRQEQQLKHFILPRDVDSDWRFMTLPHPRTAVATRFLSNPDDNLYIFTRLSVPLSDPRSILFTPEPTPLSEGEKGQGHISKDADLFVATLFDCVFLLLPILLPARRQFEKALFQSLEDILESSMDEDRSWRQFVRTNGSLLEQTAARVCDTVEAGDEAMYRVNEDKVFQMLLEKARNVVSSGLPASMEEKFVTRALEAPLLSLKRETASVTTLLATKSIGEDDDENDTADSQSTIASTTVSSVFSEVSSTSTLISSPEETVPAKVTELQRLRTAFTFIAASYLPSHIAELFIQRLDINKKAIDFTPLHDHLSHLATLKSEALATRSLTDFSRKRGSFEDEDMAKERAEKKRKMDEEEKRKKAGISHGVRALQKVNVSGMKKMSDFFGKKPAATAKG